MSDVLDIVALRSLTSIADAGGFRRAAESLHLSQPAVSQHVRRLEHACGQRLVDRDRRVGVHFTVAGELLVAQARKVLAAHDDALERVRGTAPATRTLMIGAPEHAADVLLPVITAHLQQAYPDRPLRFRIDRGSVLRQRVDEGSVDAAVLLGEGTGPRTRPAAALPLAWYAAPGWRKPRSGRAVPLAVIDEPCTIRRRALQALTAETIPNTVVCEAGHLAGVIQAVRARLGVALLASCGGPPDGLERRTDLPPVKAEPTHVRSRPGVDSALAATVIRAVGEALSVDQRG